MNPIGSWLTLSNILRFEVVNKFDKYYQLTVAQMASCPQEQIAYCVENMDGCPEDAIIDRDLFTAEDYIAAIQLGMDLREKGYTNVSVEWKEELI